MIASWSNFRPDIKFGNSYDFGNFDQCRGIQHKSENYGTVNGQYCLIQFYSISNRTIRQAPKQSVFNYGWHHLDTRFGGAVCVPSSCPPEIVGNLMKAFFEDSDLILATDYNQKDYCKNFNTSEQFSQSFVLLACLTLALVLFVMLGTFYDLRTRAHDKKNRDQVLLSFSLYTNASNLFNMDDNTSPDDIKCLHGIRALSIISIIFLHSHYHRAMFPIFHPEQLASFASGFYSRFISAISVSVDSFFLMSGLLVTRSILKDIAVWVPISFKVWNLMKIVSFFFSGRFNIFRLYFRRFLRLTPSLIIVLLTNVSLGYYFVNNAPYAFKKDLIEPCEKNWWSTLLYIQVYTNPKQLCMPPTWYLSVEWEMFILAPFLIYPVKKFGCRYLLLLLPAMILTSFYYGYQTSLQNKITFDELHL